MRPALYLLGLAMITGAVAALPLITAGPVIRLDQNTYDTSKAFLNPTYGWHFAAAN